MDATKARTISTGINAGVGDAPESQQTILPGIDYTFSTATINNLINSFNGFGFLNIGKVTPEFYLSIKALETQGILDMRSTPQLATINGHEASMSIGATEYYLETSNNVIGSQNPQNIITQTYKAVNADLTVTIKPIVSGDDQVTLEISVDQSDFTGRSSPNAPPGSVSRKFESVVRMKNEEMIMLGGLEERKREKSGSGTPFLSRIPVIKWFFTNRTDTKETKKLNIFIKPTILY